MASPDDSVAAEQAFLDDLLRRIDDIRAGLERRLANVRREADIDDPQGLMLRDREALDISNRLDSYTAADVGLVFGRIDVEDSDPEWPVASPEPGASPLDRRYIGRIGLSDTDEEMTTLLMDWRAPLARPFYLATTLRPEGVHQRRHITTRGRTVTAVSDEFLTPAAQAAAKEHAENASGRGGGVGTEGALLDALNRARTTHMRDIVETIAAEQDAIIRSPFRGVSVVQGPPGSGKTAVALHRAAYLLYTWREQLASTGVLIVGPNDRFLSYISQVLPTLGETGVVLATPGSMLQGIETTAETSLLSREVKGSAEMVTILANAVRLWQTVPETPRPVTLDSVRIFLTPQMVHKARTKARRSRRPHNLAHEVFANSIYTALTRSMAERIGKDPLGGQNLLSPSDRARLREEIAADDAVNELVNEFWPRLTPEFVLAHLLDSPDAATTEYDDNTRAGLHRSIPELAALALDDDLASAEVWDQIRWTDADTPLLDELTELLGFVDDEAKAAADRKKWLEEIAEAQEALDILTGSASQDLDDGFAPEILMAYDVIDAETLASRQQVKDQRSTAQRAAADARWAFGHVIVDEAQELSPMAWRMIFRRSPNRWMTIVGDPAQTGNPAGADSWNDVLAPFVAQRWQAHELTVNYRTPGDISALANQLLPLIAPEQKPARSMRERGTGIRLYPGEVTESAIRRAVEQARAASPEGLIGVIQLAGTDEAADYGRDVLFVTPLEAKGLEFDEVILVDAAGIVDASPMGLNDLYVCITRATQGLSFVGDTPPELDVSDCYQNDTFI